MCTFENPTSGSVLVCACTRRCLPSEERGLQTGTVSSETQSEAGREPVMDPHLGPDSVDPDFPGVATNAACPKQNPLEALEQ